MKLVFVKGKAALKDLAAQRAKVGKVVSDHEICYAMGRCGKSSKNLSLEEIDKISSFAKKVRRKGL